MVEDSDVKREALRAFLARIRAITWSTRALPTISAATPPAPANSIFIRTTQADSASEASP